MLQGERDPDNDLTDSVQSLLLILFLSPWLLMGVGLFVVGFLAMGPRKNDLNELWICLPAGLMLLLLVGAVFYWVSYRWPRMKILKFDVDGTTLNFQTKSHGDVSQSITDLSAIQEQRNRRGFALVGWWLRFQQPGWVFLETQTTNARELIAMLGPAVHYQLEKQVTFTREELLPKKPSSD